MLIQVNVSASASVVTSTVSTSSESASSPEPIFLNRKLKKYKLYFSKTFKVSLSILGKNKPTMKSNRPLNRSKNISNIYLYSFLCFGQL